MNLRTGSNSKTFEPDYHDQCHEQWNGDDKSKSKDKDKGKDRDKDKDKMRKKTAVPFTELRHSGHRGGLPGGASKEEAAKQL